MSTTEITCPSGLTATVRGMTVKESRLLGDRAAVRSGAFQGKLLNACVTVEDVGPAYSEDGFDWKRALVGDRFYALVAVRVATYGPKFAFRCKCPSCSAQFPYEVDLMGDLEVRRLTPEDAATFRDGNRFAGEAPGVGGITYRLLTGAEERLLAKQLRKSRADALAIGLSFSVIEFAGVAAGERAGFIEALSMADARALRDYLDEHDCGIETDPLIECPECWWEWNHDLPFDQGEAFWFPKGTGR